jgi:4-hydroxybenzoate polyprenyltransferase
MKMRTALSLGRVSNLPTVWSNALAGVVLAGGSIAMPEAAAALIALSLLYTAGMFLNDAFDRDFDRRHRADRPIPSGQTTAAAVFAAGFAQLIFGAGILAACGAPAAAAGAGLAAAIVLYDAWHKENPASPVLMGCCRLLAYCSAAAAAVHGVPEQVWIAASVCFSYLIGLTCVARQETLQRPGNLWPLLFLAAPLGYGVAVSPGHPLAWLLTVILTVWIAWFVLRLVRIGRPAIPRTVISLIAGISLVDGLFLAAMDANLAAALAVAAFGLTLALQRWVSGT